MKFRNILLVAAGVALMSSAAFGAPSSVDDFLGSTSQTDASVSILEKVIGVGRLTAPFTAGSPVGAIADMFLVLNVFVFLIGIFFASYGIGAGIVQTAHEGQVLGKRMSAIWMPIRMVTGIAGLLPVFGGFSLSQAVMMVASLLGIGLANYSWNQTLGDATTFSGIAAPAIGTATAGTSPNHLAYAMFSAKVCQLAYADFETENETHPDDKLKKYQKSYSDGTTSATYFNGWGKVHSGSYTPVCGKISVGPKELTTWESIKDVAGQVGEAVGLSTLGYSINSVDYRGVRDAVATAAPAKAVAMETTINALATAWYSSWKASLAGSTDANASLSLPKASIQAAAATFVTEVQTSGVGAKEGDGVITANAVANMKSLGWFGAGAWYSTLAQAQSALNDAMKNIDIKVVDAMSADVPRAAGVQDVLNAYQRVYDQANPHLDDGDPWSNAFDGGFTGPTGNISVGQRIAKEMIDGVGGDTGGSGQMNPVIALKNLGDYLMTASQAALVADAWKNASPVGKVINSEALTGGAKASSEGSTRIGRTLTELASSGYRFVMGLMTAIFVVGAIFSIYIPFIPFIQWMGGLLQYVSIFFEGLLGAPIWAFAHLDAEGEGMGQRTERGYLFLLNMLFRPFLMIFGFVLAAALLPLLGTFQAVLFVPAMANVQGNSVTGLASILFLLAIFGLLNITMIHGIFNLITIIPDQILGWVGNVTGQTIGKDTDDRANNLFLNVGRSSGQALAGSKKPEEKEKR